MLIHYLICFGLQTATQPSKDADILSKLFALLLEVLHAIFSSGFFWACVAVAGISVWISWIVRDAVKDAVDDLDLDERVRRAVRKAMEEAEDD